MHPRALLVTSASWLALALLAPRVVRAAPWGDGPAPEQAESPNLAPPSRGPEHVYANLEAGVQTLDVETLVQRNLRPEGANSFDRGAFYGIGGGLRFGFMTLGGRIRRADFQDWNLMTVDGELGARVTIDRVEPYFTFGAGYAKLDGKGQGLAGLPDVSIHGWNGRAGVGIDYYAARYVTVGLNFTGDLLVMAKDGVDLSSSPEAQAEARAHSCDGVTNLPAKEQCLLAVLHDAEGSSFGFAGAVSFVMGLHF
jgi:hypothetical protein